jgi:Flp pilus assembly protein TadG
MALLRKVFSGFIKPSRRSFLRDERGTTAIEFGILGIPFFALLAAILETSYVFLAGQILDTAVQDSARFIRTGQMQKAGYDLADFNQAICDGLYGLFDCTKLRINITTVTSKKFADAAITSPLATTCDPTSCDWAIPEAYETGNGTDIILVRVYYKWPTLVNLGGFNLSNTGANSRLLGSVRVFANEPFGDS